MSIRLNGNILGGPQAVDSAMSSTSTKPVQNKVIKQQLDLKLDKDAVNQANGVAGLDANGKLNSGTMPDSVVPSTRKVNNKALSADISLNVADVGAIPSTDKGAANGVASLDANGKLPYSQLPVLMLNDAPTTSTAGHLTQQAFVASTGKSYQLIGIDSTDPNAPVYSWAECINSANLPAIPPVGLSGSGAPTTSTVGKILQEYIDNDTQRVYTCTAITNTGTEAEPVYSYTWQEDARASEFLKLTGGTLSGALTIGGNKGLIIGAGNTGLSGITIGGTNTNWYGLSGRNCSAHANSIAFGLDVHANGAAAAFGQYSTRYISYKADDIALKVGIGTSSVSKDGLLLSRSGHFYVSGGYQQECTVIPHNIASVYTLHDGAFSHSPDSAPTYAFPAIIPVIITDRLYYTRDTTHDGGSYYGWKYNDVYRYTASPNPAVGDNTYTNTGLTAGAQVITAIDTRTHHITLNVYFRGYARSSDDDGNGYYAWKDGTDLLYTDTPAPTATETVVYSDTALTTSVGTVALYEGSMIALAASASFEDAAGNDIVPRSTPTIKPGTVVQYLCEWEPCTSQWVIMPIPMIEGGAA